MGRSFCGVSTPLSAFLGLCAVVVVFLLWDAMKTRATDLAEKAELKKLREDAAKRQQTADESAAAVKAADAKARNETKADVRSRLAKHFLGNDF